MNVVNNVIRILQMECICRSSENCSVALFTEYMLTIAGTAFEM